jgi:hypothetical protein
MVRPAFIYEKDQDQYQGNPPAFGKGFLLPVAIQVFNRTEKPPNYCSLRPQMDFTSDMMLITDRKKAQAVLG